MARSRPPVRAVIAAVVVLVGIVVGLHLLNRPGASAPGAALPGKVVNRGTATVAPGATLNITLGSTSFAPTFVKGPSGARIVLHLQNEGYHAHTFTAPALGVDVVLAPGQVADVPVKLPDPGTVRFECTFHSALGMKGAFILR